MAEYGRRTTRAFHSISPGIWILTGIFTFVGMLNLLPFLASVAAAAGILGVGNEGLANLYDNTPILAGLPETTIAAGVTTLGLLFLAMSILHFLTAWGIWNLHRWAWGLGIVLSIIALLFFPIGTIGGVVALVYLIASRPAFAPAEYVEETADRPRAV